MDTDFHYFTLHVVPFISINHLFEICAKHSGYIKSFIWKLFESDISAVSSEEKKTQCIKYTHILKHNMCVYHQFISVQ